MGFRVLLIAVTGKKPDMIHREYGVVPTGKREDIPESPVVGAILPGGAYLVYINDEIVPDDKMFALLSKNAALIACYANETVMDSYACSWVNGVEKWSVFHDAQQNPRHLETTGDLPKQLKAIQKKLLAAQDEDDEADYLFDIPIELFVSQGGIRYDQDIDGAGPDPWAILKRA